MKTEVYAPANSAPIREFFVFLSADENGDGIISTQFGDLMLPLVTGVSDLAERMKGEAAHIAQLTGKRIVLARFTAREDIWTTEMRQ